MNLFPPAWIDRIIGINSETERSNVELVKFLSPLLREAGLHVQEHEVRENGQVFVNLIGYNSRPDHPDLLLLNTHLDTVSGGDRAHWTKTGNDPWKATWVRDRIYGLGAADVKIDFLCKLWAVRQAVPKRPIALVGTYGEERGLVGVQRLFRDKKVTPRYAMVGEPSNLELVYAHKGHLIATASLPLEKGSVAHSRKWRGKAAHSSTPQLGVNALSKAFADIEKHGWGITRLEGGTDSNRIPESAAGELTETATHVTQDWFDFIHAVEGLARKTHKLKDGRFSPSITTLSWNLCRIVGDRAELTFDFRTIPDVDPRELRTQLEPLLPKSGKWSAITVDLPLAGDKETTLMKAATKALKACGVKPVKKTKASSTEAAIYHQNGAQAVVFGPGISVGNVHKPNEYNLLSQIRVATRFYQELLERPWEEG